MEKPLPQHPAPHFGEALIITLVLMPITTVMWSLNDLGNLVLQAIIVLPGIVVGLPAAWIMHQLKWRKLRRQWQATVLSVGTVMVATDMIFILGTLVLPYIAACNHEVATPMREPDLLNIIVGELLFIFTLTFYYIPATLGFYIIKAFVRTLSTHPTDTEMTHSRIIDKMKQHGLSQAAISAFLHGVNELRSRSKMEVPEEEIRPAEGLPEWDELVAATEPADAELLAQAALIKLNGGLGTSMGLQQAKSLLEIKPGITFLDLIVRQVQTLRQQAGCHVQLLLMNSFSTSADTMQYLSKYAEGGFADPAQVELLQNKVPKLAQDTLEPIDWPARPELEWCPPGHGDIYPALAGSGWLEKLLARGIKYAFVSNSDNLGAQLDTRFLRWFAESGAPFVMEVTPRTEADKKGGHLAIRRADGQPILREVAQCPAKDVPHFQDISRHRYFNTNNLWIRLDALRDFMAEHGGVVPLPVICNAKHVDPRDAATPPVYQLETAMGAALQCFAGARAVCVPRSRFFPVKTSSDLLLLRSDAVEISPAGEMQLAPECGGVAPIISLDAAQYKLVDSLDALGVPSLKHVRHLTVHGKWTFTPGQALSGDVEVGQIY